MTSIQVHFSSLTHAMDGLKHQESTVAADLLGHKLEASTSREDVHKMMHEVLDARAELREAKKKAKFRGRVIGLGLVVLVLGFAACLLASYLGIKITKDTKHKHESGTESGTEVLETSDGKPITMTQTVYEHTGDEKMCALLGADPENIPDARSLGGLRDITFTYQGETSQSVLHMHVSLIKYDVPDDPEDDEAIIGEVTSVSGRYSVVLAQSGAVSISKDGKLFATEKVCDVAEHRRRRLQYEDKDRWNWKCGRC